MAKQLNLLSEIEDQLAIVKPEPIPKESKPINDKPIDDKPIKEKLVKDIKEIIEKEPKVKLKPTIVPIPIPVPVIKTNGQEPASKQEVYQKPIQDPYQEPVKHSESTEPSAAGEAIVEATPTAQPITQKRTLEEEIELEMERIARQEALNRSKMSAKELKQEKKHEQKLAKEKMKLELETLKHEQAKLKTQQAIMDQAGVKVYIDKENNLVKFTRTILNLPLQALYLSIDLFKLLAIGFLLTIVCMYFVNVKEFSIETIVPDLIMQMSIVLNMVKDATLKFWNLIITKG